MKIFSLQSKTVLVGWSVVLGIVIDYIVTHLTYEGIACIQVVGSRCPVAQSGWPLRFEVWRFSDYFNLFDLVFWILVALIILSIIRYFRRGNYRLTSK